MKTVTTINGRFVSRKNAKISVFDNTLLYAEGLFETCLCVDDTIVFEKEHLARLRRGVKVTDFSLPVDDATLSRWMNKTARAHPARIKQLRLTLTAGESARYVGRQGKPQVILCTTEYKPMTRPFRLLVSDFVVDANSIFRQVKTVSYAIHAAALKKAKAIGYDDAIMVNGDGHVAEVTSANIFWVKNNQIFTPPLEAGCLEGITRKVIMKQAKILGYPIFEKHISVEQLLKCNEVAISSSLKLVMPVGKIKFGRRVVSFKTGNMTEQLQVCIRQLAGL